MPAKAESKMVKQDNVTTEETPVTDVTDSTVQPTSTETTEPTLVKKEPTVVPKKKRKPREPFSANALRTIVRDNTHYTQVEGSVCNVYRDFISFALATLLTPVIARLIIDKQSTMSMDHFEHAFEVANIFNFKRAINPVIPRLKKGAKGGKVKEPSKILQQRLDTSKLPLQSVRHEILKVANKLLENHFHHKMTSGLRTARDFQVNVLFFLEDMINITASQTSTHHLNKKKLLQRDLLVVLRTYGFQR